MKTKQRKELECLMKDVAFISKSAVHGLGVFTKRQLLQGFQFPYMGKRSRYDSTTGSERYRLEISPKFVIEGDPKFSPSRYNFAYRINEPPPRIRPNAELRFSVGWAKEFARASVVLIRDVERGEEIFTGYGREYERDYKTHFACKY